MAHTADLEIPLLREDLQATCVDLPIKRWGSVSRRTQFKGTWHFYTADEKFSALWKHPDTLLKSQCHAAIEANFSTGDQMPLPVVLYRIYQKRWLARFWQDFGNVKIWVDLNVAEEWQELNLHGVPKGWKAYATAVTDERLDTLKVHAEIAHSHAEGKPLLLVYGGGKKTAKICEQNEFIHVREQKDGR